MSTLLALDPAAEKSVSDTGFALIEFDKDQEAVIRDAGVIQGGYDGFVSWAKCSFPEVDIVVCEQFIHYNKVADPTPLLIEGIVRFICPDVVLQPSSALSMVTEDDLRRLRLYSTEGHHKDQNSAIRHGLFYLRTQRHYPTLKALSE